MKIEILADSRNPNGGRLTTFRLKYPRFIHSEFLTHRVFSRNSSSSRAVSFERQIEALLEDPVIPQFWPKEQKGMQAKEYVTDELEIAELRRLWQKGMQQAINAAIELDAAGVHKQIVNRMLEPYSWIHTIVTADRWDNFFKLRCSDLAEPHMQALAEGMRDALEDSAANELDWGEIHSPLSPLPRSAVARCARVCYKTDDKETTQEEDDMLYLKLRDNGHMSPLEHVAMAADEVNPSSNLVTGWRSTRTMEE